jgi:hypothetical protein
MDLVLMAYRFSTMVTTLLGSISYIYYNLLSLLVCLPIGQKDLGVVDINPQQEPFPVRVLVLQR